MFTEENASGGMVMPVSPMGNAFGGGNGMFGNDGWWIILLFILLGGWGNGYGNGGTGAMSNYVLASDMSMLERRTDSIINGICDSQFNTAQQINGLSQQMASCCCDIREGISGINYNMAMNNNNIQNAICNSTREILDALNCQAMESKNTRIAELERQLTMANLSASQNAQTLYLERQMSPCPIPAYVVPNPNCCYTTTTPVTATPVATNTVATA